MSQTLSAATLLTVPLAPLAGSLLAGILGTAFGGNRIGRVASHGATILGVLVAFILSALTLQSVLGGAHFNQTIYEWMTVGNLKMEVGFLIDSLTATMMCVVTFVSLMVHIYTIGYMAEDDGYNRFFSYISLFTFSMLMLVMSNNFLQLFFGWEAVGLVSYLLIGFWYKRETAIFANMKAFLFNRVGDFGFILGIGLIAAFAGTLNYSEVFAKSGELAAMGFPGTDWMLITVICIGLFIGAMGKSAQFPLHVWLPDSMEGPTPISALIHAATMVTAGIFMVARMSPLFELSDAALNFILIIGAITALFMGFLGIIENDIKRVVAYSTLSQLGYMTVALGAFVTSLYSFRLLYLSFFGEERFRDAHAHDAHGHDSHAHDDHHHDDHGHHGAHVPHESPWVVTLPLVLLAIPSVLIGFFTVGPMLFGTDMLGHAKQLPFFLGAIEVLKENDVVAALAKDFHGPIAFAVHGLTAPAFWLALMGFLLATLLYLVKPEWRAGITRTLAWPIKVLENKYWMDEVWIGGFAGGGVGLGKLSRLFDSKLIDGVAVNGSAGMVGFVASMVRKLQSGYLYHYAFAMILGLVALLALANRYWL